MDACYTFSILIHMMLVQVPTAMTRLSSKIYLKEPDYPIVYERNVTLFCNTSEVDTQKTTWMKQSDVILHQGLSFYPDKYTGNDVTDGSTLTILNVTFADVNVSYTCLSEVFSYEKVLLMNSTNFISLPKNTEITWIILERTLYVQLKLIRIFPVPNCTVILNDVLLPTSQRESMHMEDVFYQGTLNLTSKYIKHICEMNLAVVCVFGSSYSEVLTTIVVHNCNDVGDGFHNVGTITGVCASFTILFTSCVCFIFLKRKYKCKPFCGKKNTGVIDDVRHDLARLRSCNYIACRMCCWIHKMSADASTNEMTESGQNVLELVTNEQCVRQIEEKIQICEPNSKTNIRYTISMSYPNKENSVVNIHAENASKSVDMRSDCVGRSKAYNTVQLVPLVDKGNSDKIKISSQTNTAHCCVGRHPSEIVNLLAFSPKT